MKPEDLQECIPQKWNQPSKIAEEVANLTGWMENIQDELAELKELTKQQEQRIKYLEKITDPHYDYY